MEKGPAYRKETYNKAHVSIRELQIIYVGTKVELGKVHLVTCVYLQPAAKLCCSTLPDIPHYLKSH